MVVLAFLGLVVWLSSALVVGASAESTGRNPWSWFGVTLIFGIFALFVYWATNPPREDEQYDGEWSFKSFSGYIMTLILSLLFGFLGGVILAMTAGDGSNQPYSVYSAITFGSMSMIIAASLFTNVYRRYLEKRKQESQKVSDALSWYEPRVIGILVLPLAIYTIFVSPETILNSINIKQSLLGLVLPLLALFFILVDVWSLGLGYPLWKLRPLAEQIRKSLS